MPSLNPIETARSFELNKAKKVASLNPSVFGSKSISSPDGNSHKERLSAERQRTQQQKIQQQQMKISQDHKIQQERLTQKKQETKETMQSKLAEPKQRLQYALQKIQQQNKESSTTKKELEDKVRKEVLATLRRAVEHLVNLILGSISIGTAGAGLIITAIPYIVTLTDLNLQMIWGSYISKGKSLLFPALTWSPIPVPLPDIFLHAILIGIDILVFLFIFISCLLIFLFVFLAMFGPQLAAGGVIAATYSYFSDPLFAQMINEFFGSFF